MEKGKYVLGLDTWEGSLDIQEQVLLDACVGFLIPRLNSIYGSTHKDDLFDKQWAEAEPFVRWPYYVYNPRLTGAQNVEWLGDNLPPGVLFVAVDVEVQMDDEDYYAIQLADFYQRAARNWKTVIYTGGWFTTYLTFWPQSDYWWARYPYFMYPAEGTPITWEELHRKIEILQWVPNCNLGPCRVWQCSGDRYKPPGCNNRAVDINVFNGTISELRDYVHAPTPPKSWAVSMTEWARKLGYCGPDPEAYERPTTSLP